MASDAEVSQPLTGRRRYRRNSNGFGYRNLILQVEYSVFRANPEGKLGQWVCLWRDAQAADLGLGEVVVSL